MIGASVGVGAARKGAAGSSLSVSIGSGDVITGTELTATVNGLVGGETVSYQWQDDGVNISGATAGAYSPTIDVGGIAKNGLVGCIATVDGEPYSSGTRRVITAQATGGADLDLAFEEDSAISSTNLIANWTANGNTLTLVSVSPALPTGLSVSSAGAMTGTPTTVTADATYTLTMEDEYGRETSDTFTLEITEVSAGAFMNFLAQRIDTNDFGATHTFNNGTHAGIPADLEGRKFVIVVNTRQGTAGAVSSVVVGGVTATPRVTIANDQRVGIYDAVAEADNDNIVVNLAGSAFCEVTIYETDAEFIVGSTANQSSGSASPYTFDLGANTLAGDFLVGGFGGFKSPAITDATLTGITRRGVVSNKGTRQHFQFDNLTGAVGGTPETLSVLISGSGELVYGQTALAVYR
jgi:hypothetical protein